jgi:hypothetical protein
MPIPRSAEHRGRAQTAEFEQSLFAVVRDGVAESSSVDHPERLGNGVDREVEISGDVEGREFHFSFTTRLRLGGAPNSRVYSTLYKGRTWFESVYAHHSIAPAELRGGTLSLQGAQGRWFRLGLQLVPDQLQAVRRRRPGDVLGGSVLQR